MAKSKNTPASKNKKQVTPPAPDDNNEGDQTNQTPPAPDDTNEGDQTNQTPPIDKFTAKCQEVAKRYAENYPSSKAFHFCSDMQVFLEGDLKEARSHQAELDGGKILTIKIK